METTDHPMSPNRGNGRGSEPPRDGSKTSTNQEFFLSMQKRGRRLSAIIAAFFALFADRTESSSAFIDRTREGRLVIWRLNFARLRRAQAVELGAGEARKAKTGYGRPNASRVCAGRP